LLTGISPISDGRAASLEPRTTRFESKRPVNRAFRCVWAGVKLDGMSNHAVSVAAGAVVNGDMGGGASTAGAAENALPVSCCRLWAWRFPQLRRAGYLDGWA